MKCVQHRNFNGADQLRIAGKILGSYELQSYDSYKKVGAEVAKSPDCRPEGTFQSFKLIRVCKQSFAAFSSLQPLCETAQRSGC